MKNHKIKKILTTTIVLIPLWIIIHSYINRNNSFVEINPVDEYEFIPTIEGVAALGQLSPAGEVRRLASPSTQFGNFPRIVQLFVKEGDYVEAGTVLAVFENRDRLIVELEQKTELLSTIDEEIVLKQEQIQRYEIAAKENVYSLVSLAERKNELLQLKKQRIIQISELKDIEIDLLNSQLISPIDGYVLSINTRVGERSNGEGVLEIGASQNMQALIEVYESDIDRVFINQNVQLTSENGGFEDVLLGKVIRIRPQVKQRKVLSTDPTGDADARIIEVLVELNQESIDFVKGFSGMKVIARFIPE